MKRDLVKPLYSSFLSCEKDTETVLRKIFMDEKQHARTLKKLLIINTKDCLDDSKQEYTEKVNEYNVKKLIDEGYIRLQPRLMLPEHEKVKSYIIFNFDNFTQSGNNEFRDCTISFDVVCNVPYWEVGSYGQRPLMICGYIDGLLNRTKLSGIGTLEFLSCNQLILDENLCGYTLTYIATHGTDDILPEGSSLADLLVPVHNDR